MCSSKGLSFTRHGYYALGTYQQAKFIKVMESNMAKCITQVPITLQICHFHLNFGWNSFNINIQCHWKWVNYGPRLVDILKMYVKFLVKKLNFFHIFLSINGIFFSEKWEMCHIDCSCSYHKWSFLLMAVIKHFTDKMICSLQDLFSSFKCWVMSMQSTVTHPVMIT